MGNDKLGNLAPWQIGTFCFSALATEGEAELRRAGLALGRRASTVYAVVTVAGGARPLPGSDAASTLNCIECNLHLAVVKKRGCS